MIGGHVANTHVSINGAMEKEEIPNGKIPFDKIFVNLANGFDIETSEFIAPTSGVYFFSYNVGKFPRKKLSVMLMKNVNEVQVGWHFISLFAYVVLWCIREVINAALLSKYCAYLYSNVGINV